MAENLDSDAEKGKSKSGLWAQGAQASTSEQNPPVPERTTGQENALKDCFEYSSAIKEYVFEFNSDDKKYLCHFKDKDASTDQCPCEGKIDEAEAGSDDVSILVVHAFRHLHLRNIYYFQRQIKSLYPDSTEPMITKENTDLLRTLLANYTEALRNYEYMLKLRQPNIKKVHKQLVLLDAHVNHQKRGKYFRLIRGEKDGFLRIFLSQSMDFEEKKETWNREVSWHEILRRIIIGVCIAAPFLLVPMIILQFKDTKAWRLSTVSAAVVVFSFFLGVLSDASNTEHLGAVAAYAAVMVVFLGTSSKM